MVQLRMCVYALLVLMGTGQAATPGNIEIVVQALDGRTGKPIENQHLLLFGGESAETAKQHKQHYELVTGRDGTATLSLTPEIQWLQVWMDWHVLCESEPKSNSFPVRDILVSGLSAPNTCGAASETAAPGHLVVFARPAHFWEKMRQ